MNEPSVPVSVTFVATSNKVTATVSEKEEESLAEVIKQNKSFQTAFNSLDHRQSYFEDLEEEEEPETKRDLEKTKGQPTIIQSSDSASPVQEARHGLVSAILVAYNCHHRLILRPDDVWQAILTQFSFYVNANAEELRDRFVDFRGKESLVIKMGGTLFCANFATFASRMVEEKIVANLKDDEVTAWLLPKFTTTRTDDRVAASVTIMSTLQAYFEFACYLSCGIPEVTLEGTAADWRLLRQKIDRLPHYDVEFKDKVMRKWHALLVPVLDEFVRASEGHANLNFWDTVCSHIGAGSGPSYLSGWVTVFACFKESGEWQGIVPDKPPDGIWLGSGESWTPKWPFIDTARLPVGAVAVPVLVDDNGTKYDTQMLAGQFAYEMTSDPQGQARNTVRPRTDWCIAYEKGVTKDKKGDVEQPTKSLHQKRPLSKVRDEEATQCLRSLGLMS